MSPENQKETQEKDTTKLETRYWTKNSTKNVDNWSFLVTWSE